MGKLYTSTGDDGYTGLLKEGRIAKYSPQTEAIGTIDEASAALGIARASCKSTICSLLLLEIQRDLYHIMAEVASSPENAAHFKKITAEKVSWLEAQIDSISATVEQPKDFIIPGDSLVGANLSLARTIVRRSERRVAQLLHEEIIQNIELLRYLNRLSSLCFIMELLEIKVAGVSMPTIAKGASQ